jgi:hypothetical protein
MKKYNEVGPVIWASKKSASEERNLRGYNFLIKIWEFWSTYRMKRIRGAARKRADRWNARHDCFVLSFEQSIFEASCFKLELHSSAE